MSARGLLWIARARIRADRRGALLDAAAACAGAAALVFFLALGMGVGNAARRMFPSDARLVEVVPSSVSLGGLLGGDALDDRALRRLEALPGVEAAWPRVILQVPIAAPEAPPGMASSWPPGMTLQIPVVGIAPAMVRADLEDGHAFEDPPPGKPIPVVLSRRLVEVYDKTIAPSWNLPRLPPGLTLLGLQMPVEIGRSIVPGKQEQKVYASKVRLAAFSERVPMYMMAIPLETARRLHAEYGKDGRFSQVTLLARRPDDVPAIAAAVRQMGFNVDEGERAAAERIGAIIAVTTGALAFLAVVMCVLAALAIARSLSASVRGRSKEIAVLQALGATPSDVHRVVLLEGAMIGLAGGVLGTLVAFGLSFAADRAALGLLPDFPFRPETFFAFPAWLPVLGVIVPAVAAVLGALAPAAAAARVEPARTLT
ncbi:MAG TPA: FtsX-like permease family protein [Anaeromyxobacter sp.]|nr:FtsX-like permease family protein [Anaeromyxobacter sp.]